MSPTKRSPAARFLLLATAAAVVVPAVFVATASAQLVLGTADRDEPLFLVDLRTIRQSDTFPVPVNVADSYPLPGTESLSIWAMTADDANERLLYLDVGPRFPGADPSSNLYAYDYSSGASTFLGQIVSRETGSGISMQGLAYTSSGELYGVHNVGGVPGHGLYRLDLDNRIGTGLNATILADGEVLSRDLPGGESAWDFGTLDYDPVTGKIYVINDDADAPQGRGLYAYDLAGNALDFVVSSPEYRRLENDFDGLATGDGKAYWVTDEAGVVYVYDLVDGGDFEDFLSPITTESGLFAGAGYAPGLLAIIPEPTTAAAVGGLAGLLLLRRRGRS